MHASGVALQKIGAIPISQILADAPELMKERTFSYFSEQCLNKESQQAANNGNYVEPHETGTEP